MTDFSFGRITRGLSLASSVLGAIGSMRKNEPITIVDIGARGGLSRGWQALWRLGKIRPIFFEPEPSAAARLRQAYPNSVVIEAGAWDRDEVKTLYVTRQPGCSSLLVPDADEKIPAAIKTMLEIKETVEVPLVDLGYALGARSVRPEVVKLDIQGPELRVLRSLSKQIADVHCIEVEVSFMRCYAGQDLMQALYDYLIELGFGLFELSCFGVANTRNAVQANAYFCKRKITSARQAYVERIFKSISGFRDHP